MVGGATEEAEKGSGNFLIIRLDGVVKSICHITTYLRRFHYPLCSDLQLSAPLETAGLCGKKFLLGPLDPKTKGS